MGIHLAIGARNLGEALPQIDVADARFLERCRQLRVSFVADVVPAIGPGPRLPELDVVRIDAAHALCSTACRGNDISPPRWIKPQLTRLVDEAPAGSNWLHEIKYDGYRMHANRRPCTPALRVIASSCSW
jgi:hypothetical protein